MADSFNVLNRAASLDESPELSGYSGVVIYTGAQDVDGNSIEYRAGDDSGTVLEITNEWGSQAQADSIMHKIRGFKYKPFSASGVLLDPSAEIGDAITIRDTYSGVFVKATTFGKSMRSDISAPGKEEIEHEFQIQSPTNRQYERFTRSVKSLIRQTANALEFEVSARVQQGATLLSSIEINANSIQQEVVRATQSEGSLSTRISQNANSITAEVQARTAQGSSLSSLIAQNANSITARVTKTGHNAANTFGWTLDAEGHTWWQGSSDDAVMKVSASGLEVNGTIRSGKIGGSNGFNITATSIYNNKPSLYASQTNGVYIGTDGIALGQDFIVTSDGTVTAARGNFGSITVRDGEATGHFGALSYDGYGSSYSGGLAGCKGSVISLSGSLSTGISVGSKNIATYVGDIVANKITAEYIGTKIGSIQRLGVLALRVGGYDVGFYTKNVRLKDGTTAVIRYLGTS